jgi:hypothetical protein
VSAVGGARPGAIEITRQSGETAQRTSLRAFLGDRGVVQGVWIRAHLKFLLEVVGPVGVAAIAVALLVVAVEAVRLLLFG